MAWTGYTNAEGKVINLAAQAGIEDASAADWHCLMEKENKKPCIALEVIQSGRIRVIKDISLEPDCTPWLDEAMRKGFTSSIFLPLTIDEKAVGVVCLYALSVAAFEPDKCKLLAQLVGEISVGIIFLRQKEARQKSDRKLAEARNELLSITNSLPVIVYRYRRDEDGTPHILYISDRIEDLWGTTVAEAKSDSVSMFRHIHPDDIAAFQEADRAAWEARIPFSHEMRIFPPRGEMRWIHLRSSPHLKKGGSLVYDGVVEDITERKLYEEALQQSQTRLARAEHIAHIGNWSFEMADGAVEWSDETWNIFGRTRLSERITYETLRPWLREDYRKFHDELMLRMAALKPGESIDPYEFCLLWPNGDERWVRVTQRVEFDRQGNPAHFFGVLQDITEREQVNAALKESEQKYRLLFENMTTAFALHEIICDDQGKPVDYRFIEANPAFEKLTGIPVDGLMGKTVREVLPNTENYWIDEYGKVALSGEPLAIEQYARGLDRTYDVWAFSPEPGKVATVFSDVTQRKRAEDKLVEDEHRFRSLFQSVSDYALVLEIRESGPPVIVDANDAAFEKHGYTREEMIGQPISMVDIKSNPELIAERMAKIRKGGLVRFEVEHVCKDGSKFIVEAAARLMESMDGRYFYSVERDITERKKAEASLQKRLDELERFSEAAVRREFRIKELKDHIKALLSEGGEDIS
jgi:PAS domain S-box-containing protein